MKFIREDELVLPTRSPDSKKGDSGEVLVIGGSSEYSGAVALAGLAALRSGVDWVTVAAPEKVGWAINALTPNLVVKKVKGEYFSEEHVEEMLELEKYFDVVLIGNGIGKQSAGFVRKYVQLSKKPLVIDADAIKVISIDMVKNSIITPHGKEFEMLMENSGIKDKKELKGKIGNNVVVLKGMIDEIITSSETYYNNTGNAGMTKGGTGDVLAGLAAGFYAQSRDDLMSAKLAVYYNGLAGDILLERKKGFTFLASDIAEEIGKIMKKMGN